MDKCKDLFTRYLAARIGENVSITWLRSLIRIEIGSDERTIDNYMQLLRQFGFIRATKENKVEVVDFKGV